MIPGYGRYLLHQTAAHPVSDYNDAGLEFMIFFQFLAPSSIMVSKSANQRSWILVSRFRYRVPSTMRHTSGSPANFLPFATPKAQ